MRSRPLAVLASLVLAGLALLVLLPDYASATSRAGAGGVTERQIVGGALGDPYYHGRPYFVFSGEVVDVKRTRVSGPMKFRFTATLRVFEVWNGPDQGTLEVNTVHPTFGGTPFKEGQEYLVYAYGKEEPFKDDAGLTKSLRSPKAAVDLALLRKLGEGEKPNNSDALNDTSGGIPARAVVGLAGLAMAASLLVMVRLVRSRT